MKIRRGFVSNSSSSSFTCDVCGEVAMGMDLGMEEADMWECQKGHCFCDEHKELPIDAKVMKEFMLSYSYIEDDEKAKIKAMDDEEVEEYFEENEDYEYEIRHELPGRLCPLCSFIDIDYDEATEYLMKKNNLTKDTLLAKIREEFQSYDDFRKFIDKKE